MTIRILRRVICPVCKTKQEVTLVFPAPAVRGHVVDGRYCTGSLMPVKAGS